jgi:hypothetical protein
MVLDHSENVDARGGTFNDVHRDQFHARDNTTIYHQTFHVNISASSPGQTLHRLLGDINTSDSRTWSEAKVLAPVNRSNTSSSGRDIAARLIIQIVQALIDPDSADLYQHLKLELKSLQTIFTLTGLAIHAYEYTPLGPSLTNIINQESERCRVVLQELLKTINRYRQGLDSTRISYFWRQVCWSGCEVDELTSLRMKLLACRESLGECLMALNS